MCLNTTGSFPGTQAPPPPGTAQLITGLQGKLAGAEQTTGAAIDASTSPFSSPDLNDADAVNARLADRAKVLALYGYRQTFLSGPGADSDAAQRQLDWNAPQGAVKAPPGMSTPAANTNDWWDEDQGGGDGENQPGEPGKPINKPPVPWVTP